MARPRRILTARLPLLLAAGFTSLALALGVASRRGEPPLGPAGVLASSSAGIPAAALPALPRLAGRAGFRAVDPRPGPAAPSSRAAAATLIGRVEPGSDGIAFALTHTRFVARVTGSVARVEVVQRYQNPTERRLEAIYAFPLPENAAVTDMTFQIGRRVVSSEVQRREEARTTYRAAREAGRTAALTEQERPNLFTQSVANVPPGECVFVVLRYVHEVAFRDGRYQLVFPTTVGPRYVPGASAGRSGPGSSDDTDQVGDGSRVTPPVTPDAPHFSPQLEVLVQLAPGEAFDDVAAHDHRVLSGLDGAGSRLVALDPEDGVPDRDFVLSYRPAGAQPEASALVERERGEEFLLLFVQPPAEVGPGIVRPRELVFLIDRSGSMSGRPLETARAVVRRSLRALGPADTFQLIAFDGATEAMSEAPLAADPDSLARAEAWLETLQGGGGTEMLAGIRAALRAPHDPGRLRLVVFCTDGFIGNEPAVIEAVDRERGDARVFGFGIGTSVNRYLIEGVARAGRGTAEVIGPADPVDAAVERLHARIDRPVLTDLELELEGARDVDLAPARLPDLFAGQPLVVAGRLGGGVPAAAVLRGRLGGAAWSRRVAIAPAPPADGAPGAVAGTLWARRRIEELTHLTPTAPGPEAVAEVVALGLRFKLLTAYTSLVAVERELLVDPGLALASVLVPGEMPEGVSHEGVFGPARVHVAPGRVKPGDPELSISAAPTARAVRVKLPFEEAWRDAVPDGEGWVARFLVPPGQPDGSYPAEVVVTHRDGSEEHRTAAVRVDTTAPAVAVLSAPPVAPGAVLRLRLKPALPLARLPGLLRHRGGLLEGIKAEIETREILVRAPWGAVARARRQGALGVWTAELPVPADGALGEASLDVVATDAAGNVSRRALPVTVALAPSTESLAAAPTLLAGALLLVALVGGMTLLLLAPRLRRRGPLVVLAQVPLHRNPEPRS